MNISLNPLVWSEGGIVAVPAAIIDRHLRLCGSLALKVILLILRDKDTYNSKNSIKEKLKCDSSDLDDALNYWQEAGIIKLSEEEGFKEMEKSLPEKKEKEEEKKEEKKPVTLRSDIAAFPLSREEVTAIIENDKTLQQLLQEGMEIFGKNFNNYEREIFVLVYTTFDLTPHFMLTLLNFCKAVNKKTLPYLKKVAEDWIEKGIDDNSVDSHMDLMLHLFSFEGRVKTALGLERNLIKPEKEYIAKWNTEYNLDVDIIVKAYEKCISAINKINFKYMDKVLASWYQNNITTGEELEAFEKQKPGFNDEEPKEKSDFMKLLEENYDKE